MLDGAGSAWYVNCVTAAKDGAAPVTAKKTSSPSETTAVVPLANTTSASVTLSSKKPDLRESGPYPGVHRQYSFSADTQRTSKRSMSTNTNLWARTAWKSPSALVEDALVELTQVDTSTSANQAIFIYGESFEVAHIDRQISIFTAYSKSCGKAVR